MYFDKKTKWGLLGSALVLVFLLWRLIFAFPTPGVLEVCFFDVGQGEAILVNHFTGKQVLIDGGPDKEIKDEIGKCQPFYDRTIETMILTHPHFDHLSGLNWVLTNYKVGKVFHLGKDHDSNTYKEFKKILEEKQIPTKTIEKSEKIDLKEGASLHNFTSFKVDNLDNLNNASIVSKLTYGSSSMLFASDAEKELQKKLIKDDVDLKADILKIPHQGARDAAFEDFLKEVAPKTAVLSIGENPYGHPHQETLELYQNIELLRTDQEGTIRVFTNGKDWEIETER